MKRITSTIFAIFAATAAHAATLDFSQGSYDDSTETSTYMSVMSGVNLVIAPINGTTQDSNNISNNGSIGGAGASSGGQLNMGITNPANSVDLRFSFVDSVTMAAVTLMDVSVGFYDLDFVQREVMTLLTPASYTLTSGSDLTTGLDANGNLQLIGSQTSNVPNPTDLANLTTAQQNASVLLGFGDVSSFDLRFHVDATNGTGRNFQFGNLTFTEPTVTVNPAPVPLPASGLLLLAGFGALALRRRA